MKFPKIEKGIKIFKMRWADAKRGGRWTSTLRKLSVGDSFLMPIAWIKNTKTPFSSISIPAKRLGIKITARKIGKTYRVWRIK